MSFNELINWAYTQLFVAFSGLISLPFDPSKRLYWPFLLVSVLFAVLIVRYRDREQKMFSVFFSRNYFLSKSTLIDCAYLALNSFVRVAVLVPLLGSKIFVAILVARFWQANFDTPPDLSWSPWVVIALYSLVFFIVDDLSRFLLHMGLHKIPLLWRFHKVHHSAAILTPLTLHRSHPLEMTFYYLRSMGVFALVTGSFVYLFGSQVAALEILGVHAFGFVFNALLANLRHSHIWLSFGKFERWFISPAQHQIHHSSAVEDKDKNFGTCLAIWDRLAGSIRFAHTRRCLSFGLTKTAEPSQLQKRPLPLNRQLFSRP